MNRYDTLVTKHGTYREFEDAAWNALGECSVGEVQAACDKYRRELADARLADLADSRQGTVSFQQAADEMSRKMLEVSVPEALERWRNSDGFACSDKTDDGVMDCLVTLAQAYDSTESAIVRMRKALGLPTTAPADDVALEVETLERHHVSHHETENEELRSIREELAHMRTSEAIQDREALRENAAAMPSPAMLAKYKKAAKETSELFCWCIENLKGFPPIESDWIDDVKSRLKPATE